MTHQLIDKILTQEEVDEFNRKNKIAISKTEINTVSRKKILEKALIYASRGWIVIPLSSPYEDNENYTKRSRGKRPIMPKWQKLTTPYKEESYRKFLLKTTNNIGLVTGKHSGIVAIDFDSFYFRDELFDGITIDTRMSARIEGRGHYYFEYPEDFIVKSRKLEELGIEIISDGNQIVAPPSIHRSGMKYKWIHKKGTPLQKFPEQIIKNFYNLKKTRDNLFFAISKCRLWLKCIWKEVFENKIDSNIFDDESFCLASTSELKANGADEKQLLMYLNIMLKHKYNKSYSIKKLSYIKPTPWKLETIKEKLPSELIKYIKSDRTETIYSNPQQVQPEIVNRKNAIEKDVYIKKLAKDVRDNCYINEDKFHNILFYDRITHKVAHKLLFKDGKHFDEDWADTGKIKEVNENNSGYYLYWLESFKKAGIPLTHKWMTSKSCKCKTRVYKRAIIDKIFGTQIEYFIVCKTQDKSGKWNTINEYIPHFTQMHPGLKQEKVYKLKQLGVPIEVLMEVFGYKHRQTVENVIKKMKKELGEDQKIQCPIK